MWVAVNKDGSEVCFNEEPYNDRYEEYTDWYAENKRGDLLDRVIMPKGTIKKMIGLDMDWQDEPIEI